MMRRTRSLRPQWVTAQGMAAAAVAAMAMAMAVEMAMRSQSRRKFASPQDPQRVKWIAASYRQCR